MPDKDLKLNSISRYSKQSPRLILEEYSHCEVPAGCGGVVLRWRNPDRDIPVPIRFYSETKSNEVYLDENELTRGRVMLTFGEHILAAKLEDVDTENTLLMFTAIYDEGEKYFSPHLSRPSGVKVTIKSEADGSWKYTTTEPGEDWKTLEFDDSAWAQMVEKTLSELTDERDHRKYWRRDFEQKEARPLGINAKANTVWIRKRFTVQKANEENSR